MTFSIEALLMHVVLQEACLITRGYENILLKKFHLYSVYFDKQPSDVS